MARALCLFVIIFMNFCVLAVFVIISKTYDLVSLMTGPTGFQRRSYLRINLLVQLKADERSKLLNLFGFKKLFDF